MFDIKNLKTKINVYETAIHDCLKEAIEQIVNERDYTKVVFTGSKSLLAKAYRDEEFVRDTDLEQIATLFCGQFGTYPTGEWANGCWTEY